MTIGTDSVLSDTIDSSFEHTSLLTLLTSVSATNAIRLSQYNSAGLEIDSDVLEAVQFEIFSTLLTQVWLLTDISGADITDKNG